MPQQTAGLSSFDRLDSQAALVAYSVEDGGELEPADGGLPTPEQVQEQISVMFGRPLSPELLGWIEAYTDVGRRDPYLWKWCRRAVELTTLPCVAPEWHEELCDTKTLGVMLDVLMDDVADRGNNRQLLEGLISLPSGGSKPDFSQLSPSERAYGEFAVRLWGELSGRAKSYPRYEEYADLLRFDYLQLCNTMRYSSLLNADLTLLNLVEHDLYTPHNMHIMICSTWDLMCSPGFDHAELGRFREAVWHGQCMGRIGNLVTTWERELGEGDFTSGVYARAVTCGDLTVDVLRKGDQQLIRSGIERGAHELYFLRRWQRHRQALLKRRPAIRSFDVADWAAGFDRLICLHLGSRGYK